MLRIPRRLSFAALCFLLVLPANLHAGKLDSFEDSVNEERPDQGRRRERAADNCLTDIVGDLIVEGFGYGMIYGGIASLTRVAPHSEGDSYKILPRTPGEPLIPLARLDFGYQDVESDVDAHDYRVEGGYGPLGFHFNQTHYSETSPEDDLDLFRLYGMYRMSFGTMVEVDLGVGALTIDGDDSDTRFSVALPVLIHPTDWIGVEIRPSWAENVSDWDVALLLTWGYSSLKAGYRWTGNSDESLDGPYAGLSVHF